MTAFEPIKTPRYSYSEREEPGITEYDETNHDEIAALLVGHAVKKVADDHLLLDDGTVLRLIGHEGGCACTAGDYDLTELNGVDNLITSVEFEDRPGGDGFACATCGGSYCDEVGHDNEGRYRIFVFADNERINLATFEGSDGNGYYGTGYSILVRKASA